MDVDNAVAAAALEAEEGLALAVVGAEAGAVAVAPGLAVDGGEEVLGADFAEALELFFEDALFVGDLHAAVGVLEGAAAALAVVGAGGGGAVGEGEDAGGLGFAVMFFAAGDLVGNGFLGQGAGDEGGFALDAGDAAAFVVDAVDGGGVHGGAREG
nr:hypothetical protein [Eikenella sp. Marseille-P7795]